MDNVVSALFTPVAGAVLGLLIALVLFSTLLGDNVLARLAQHILVGAALGYAALLAIRDLLLPTLATAWTDTSGRGWLWLPLALGALLWLAGFDTMRRSADPADLPIWRQVLRTAGMLPLSLLFGVGITVGLVGAWQGTLVPQIAVVRGVVQQRAQPLALFEGLLGLLLTTATLLYLTWPQNWRPSGSPRWLQAPATVWRWIGLRALWFAGGMLFARLAAARLSLLIGWIEMVGRQFESTGLRALWSALWERL